MCGTDRGVCLDVTTVMSVMIALSMEHKESMGECNIFIPMSQCILSQ